MAGSSDQRGIFHAVAEPHRRAILDLLLHEGDQTAGSIAARFPLAQPTVSKHLRVLRDVGIVTVRSDAQRRWYQLNAEQLVELDEWLEPYRQQWIERLDALERHLESMPD